VVRDTGKGFPGKAKLEGVRMEGNVRGRKMEGLTRHRHRGSGVGPGSPDCRVGMSVVREDPWWVRIKQFRPGSDKKVSSQSLKNYGNPLRSGSDTTRILLCLQCARGK
jgi:hypothetical protein